MASQDSEFKPSDQLDRFRLERLLGSGAFGEVWLAMDEGEHGFRKRVALKILAKHQSEQRIEALMREARICGALNHPNVVDVTGVMQAPQASFIIMEYVDGETLSAMSRDLEYLELRFPRAIILDIGIAVSEALYHGWKAVDAAGTPLKIVHRDLKPANVMISDRGVVKVADFGIAKVAPDVTVTRRGKLKGTPSYMAPELWTGTRDFKPSIDLWGLGVIMWEMSVGKRFFGKASIAEIFDLVRNRMPGDEVEQVRSYFPELVPVLAKLLQRDPELRYQSSLKLAEDLRAIRHKLGPAGDLAQFSRLLRAGRVEPAERDGSLAVLPALPPDADDWEPLLRVAAGEDPPVQSAEDVHKSQKLVPVKIGPDEPGEATASDLGDTSEAAALDESIRHPAAQLDTIPLPNRGPQDDYPPPVPWWQHPMLWMVIFGILAVGILAWLGLGAAPE